MSGGAPDVVAGARAESHVSKGEAGLDECRHAPVDGASAAPLEAGELRASRLAARAALRTDRLSAVVCRAHVLPQFVLRSEAATAGGARARRLHVGDAQAARVPRGTAVARRRDAVPVAGVSLPACLPPRQLPRGSQLAVLLVASAQLVGFHQLILVGGLTVSDRQAEQVVCSDKQLVTGASRSWFCVG